MGYGYNPIVGENWRYNPEKHLKLVDPKLNSSLTALLVFIKM